MYIWFWPTLGICHGRGIHATVAAALVHTMHTQQLLYTLGSCTHYAHAAALAHTMHMQDCHTESVGIFHGRGIHATVTAALVHTMHTQQLLYTLGSCTHYAHAGLPYRE